jgi:DNA-binding MarR family transcriptional regulator
LQELGIGTSDFDEARIVVGNDIGPLIKLVDNTLDKCANNFLRHNGVTARQGMVLMTLYSLDEKSASLKSIEKRFNVSQPTMAGIIARLEEKGLVATEYDPDDRRAKNVFLTDSGIKLCGSCGDDIVRMESELEKKLTPRQKDELIDLLKIVYETIR